MTVPENNRPPRVSKEVDRLFALVDGEPRLKAAITGLSDALRTKDARIAELERIFADTENARILAIGGERFQKTRADALARGGATEARDVIRALARIVQTMVDHDPDEPIADGGHRMLDLWRHDAKPILSDARVILAGFASGVEAPATRIAELEQQHAGAGHSPDARNMVADAEGKPIERADAERADLAELAAMAERAKLTHAVRAERERCAQIADPPLMHRKGNVGLWRKRRAEIAAAIRAESKGDAS